uniref:hypothetical protein n=1 Tax=Sulfuriferula sp. GW6 TaxID=3345112 RepID=UPI0039F6DEA8
MIAWLRASPKWLQVLIVLLAAWVPFTLAITNHPILSTVAFIGLTWLFLIAQPLRLRTQESTAPDQNEPTPPAQ